MEYAVGQDIVHPAHGTGKVVDIEEQELVEGFDQYYVIRFADKRLTVRVPFSHSDDAGLRKLMSRNKTKQVLKTLRQLPQKLPKDFKKRRKQLEEKIYSGYPLRIAEAVRELTWRREHKNLGMADQRLLDQGREMLIQELALATDATQREVQKTIDDALSVSIEAKEATLEE